MLQPLSPAIFDSLDMQTRWEIYLRGKFYGSWAGTPLQLQALRL
jgi:hypothetical protein